MSDGALHGFPQRQLRGHGAESDTPLDATAWQTAQFRHGKCIRWRVYMSKAEALAAAGLREGDSLRLD